MQYVHTRAELRHAKVLQLMNAINISQCSFVSTFYISLITISYTMLSAARNVNNVRQNFLTIHNSNGKFIITFKQFIIILSGNNSVALIKCTTTLITVH